MKQYSLLIALQCFFLSAYAQKTAKLYRGGTLIGTYSTIDSALKKATNIGDSILLSAHTFKEYNLQMSGGLVIQGTMNSIDSTIIDAEYKGLSVGGHTGVLKYRAIRLINIIFTRGVTSGLYVGGGVFSDTLMLKGRTIVRNGRSLNVGGGVETVFLYDYAKLTHNTADSFGGAGVTIYAYDSSEICYNSSRYGGAVGNKGGSGKFYCNSPGVRIHHNTATVGGGALACNVVEMTAGQITDNQAPIGAAFWTYPNGNFFNLTNCYIYNLTPAGKRQNEIYYSGTVNINGSWFGKSDTVGLISINYSPIAFPSIIGKYAIANWSINKGKPITNKDTLFPIGAGFTYSDGTALPPNALPWLQGMFSSSTGKMLTPNPRVSPTDTMSSLFRTYVYTLKNDTTSKPINFVCIVDGDTFRTSPRVWGIDSIKLSIGNKTLTTLVRVYPNPCSDFINIEGLEGGTSIELYDINGRLIKSEKLIVNNALVDVQNLSTGTYLLKITNKEGAVGTAKIMVND